MWVLFWRLPMLGVPLLMSSPLCRRQPGDRCAHYEHYPENQVNLFSRIITFSGGEVL